MESELDIIDSLAALRYKGDSLKQDVLTSALDGGLRSPVFREVVCWLTDELHVLRKTDEKVDIEVTDPSEFSLELSALLKELGCTYDKFVTGALSERFDSKQSCIQLLEYLVTELMATKMSLKFKPVVQTYVISKSETDTARTLEMLTKDLCLGKPPENISPKALFDKINFKVEELQRTINKNIICEPLLKPKTPLTDAQWRKLEEIHSDLDSEYDLRRRVLLTRLEVTIQSFQWADKFKNREDEIMKRFQKKLAELDELKCGGKDTNIVALLSARSDLAIIEKTSSANVRQNTGTKIHKHVIGSVPDRGGRANEHAPPPPEMPSWQQQRAGGPGGGRGNFQGGRGNLQGGRGNFQGGRGNFQGGGGRDGASWQQHGSQGQQGQFKNRPQQYEQRPQFEQGNNQRDWASGSGRVQGTGWSQRGNDRDRDRSRERDYDRDRGRGENYQHQQQHRGQGGGNRGRGNYNNRGGHSYRR